MGTFSSNMRTMATELTKKLGNSCTLTAFTTEPKVYDPLTGEYTAPTVPPSTYQIYSAPSRDMSAIFGRTGENTNLSGFNDASYTIPWFGFPVTEEWLYNGQNILSVAPLESQDDVIAYNITVGIKE